MSFEEECSNAVKSDFTEAAEPNISVSSILFQPASKVTKQGLLICMITWTESVLFEQNTRNLALPSDNKQTNSLFYILAVSSSTTVKLQ